MPAQTIQNPSALIGNVPALDGNSVGFPAWCTRLEELFAIQGVHDIVTGKLVRPETDYKDKDSKPITQGSQRVYYAEESASDWDSLSDVPRETLKMTLSIDLAIRYKEVKPVSVLFKTICDAHKKNTRARRMMLQDTFWSARHDPNQPIAKWIAKVRNAASDLKSVKLTPADQQICDRLLRGNRSAIIWYIHQAKSHSTTLLGHSRPTRSLLKSHSIILRKCTQPLRLGRRKRPPDAGRVENLDITHPPVQTRLSKTSQKQGLTWSKRAPALRQRSLSVTAALAMMKKTILIRKSTSVGDEV
jgi:hypothetical protein